MRGYGLFIPAYVSSGEDAARALAETAGFSIIDARMILASRRPRRVGVARTREEAEDRALSLKGAGFEAFVVSFESLRSARPPQVRAARFEDDGVRFEPAGSFRRGSLRLFVHGKILSCTRLEGTVIRHTENEPVRETSPLLSQDSSEPFLHLYGYSWKDALEVRPGTFDPRCLGKDRAPTRSASFLKLIDRLRAFFPEARYDDTLLRYPPAMDEQEVRPLGDLVGEGILLRDQKWGNEGAALTASRLIAISFLRR